MRRSYRRRALSPTERFERYGLPPLQPRDAAPVKPAVFKTCPACRREFTFEQWEELPWVVRREGQQSDEVVRACHCGGMTSRIIAHRYACSICGGESCRSAACAEEAGIRGMSRLRRVA